MEKIVEAEFVIVKKVDGKDVDTGNLKVEITEGMKLDDLRSSIKLKLVGNTGVVGSIYSKRKDGGKETPLDLVDEILEAASNSKSKIVFKYQFSSYYLSIFFIMYNRKKS